MPYLFAIGSALHRSQMERRLMGNRPFTRAVLSGYRLAFRGKSLERRGAVADLLPDPAGRVPGLLYELPDATVRHVDRAEAVERGLYEPFDVQVATDDGATHPAVAYRLADPQAAPGIPNTAYLMQMRQGYREWGLDEGIIEAALTSPPSAEG